jgi:hypothetical protein
MAAPYRRQIRLPQNLSVILDYDRKSSDDTEWAILTLCRCKHYYELD